MLRVVQSNRLETLADELVAMLAAPAGDVLTPDVVVVQNRGMARWLALRIAGAHGICANVRFPLPAAFVWECFDAVLGTAPNADAFAPSVTAWRLMTLLGRLDRDERFAPLAAYGTRDDDRRRFELARRIADVFDQFLVYRPDWIRRWEAGEGSDWQAELWRRIAAGAGADAPHRGRRFDAFVAALEAGRVDPRRLPPRVAVFGISALPPATLEVLARLGDVVDVRLHLLNPCRESWSYIVSERELARRAAERDVAAAHLEVGHPLLASLGLQGRDFIDLVLERTGGQVDDAWTPPAATTLLGRLQADVLDLRTPAPGAREDGSIRFHACHGPLREVEVLHDRLLDLFEAHPDLTPADVVVMTPDIETYAPAFEAVFGTAPPERKIPYTIADRALGVESPVVRAFLALLELPASRYEASRLLALLDVEAVRRRFGFSETDHALARAWVREAGVRWGIDAAARRALGLPATAEHTWRVGLDRLLLGYARRGVDRRIVAGLLPVDDVEGTQARAAGLLATFAESAFALQADLAAPRPPAAWAATLADVLDRFLETAVADDEDAQAVRSALAALAEAAATAGSDDPVSLGVVEAYLRHALASATPTGRFLSGGVTLCAMVPMRSIPFDVVCLVGLNDGVFPRMQRPHGFDLLATDRRRGDRSRRDDDRWLFLEAILSARRVLYVSWIGQDVRDNTTRPPSPLVLELQDVLERGYGAPHAVVRHPLQPFSPRCFGGDARCVSYAEEFAAASRVSLAPRRQPRPFFEGPLPPPADDARTVRLDDLVGFFRNPARALLRNRLGIRLEESEGLVASREPFAVGGLDGYAIRTELLDTVQTGRSLDDAVAIARAAGLLPHARPGEVLVGDVAVEVDDMLRRLRALLDGGPCLPPLTVDLPIGEWRLVGRLDDVTPAGRVDHRAGHVKAGDWTTLWIRHLVLHCIAPPGVRLRSAFVARTEDVVLGEVRDARAILATLIGLYGEGLRRPLPYVPGAALAAVKATSAPLRAARQAWEGNDFNHSAGDDPYLALAFRGLDPIGDEFLELAETVLRPVLTARVG